MKKLIANLTEYHRISVSITESYWGSLSVSECQWLSLTVTECHWVSLSVTECHWVSLSVTECHDQSNMSTSLVHSVTTCLILLPQKLPQRSKEQTKTKPGSSRFHSFLAAVTKLCPPNCDITDSMRLYWQLEIPRSPIFSIFPMIVKMAWNESIATL